MEGSDSPIIIKKIKKGHGGHHGGAWKVAFADFVTAMMALFIVLWILGQDQEVKEAVAGYFKDPVGFSAKSSSLIDGKGPGSSQLPNLTLSQEELVREAQKQDFERMQESLKRALEEDTGLNNFSDLVKIEMTKDGLNIELTDNANDIFFELGTSQLKPDARKLIGKIGAEISKMPNKIVVEGHTDARQFKNIGTGFTNFELSADRALSAKRALVYGGMMEKQIDEVVGYADTRLRDKNDPFSFVNRRISITLKFNEAK
ncbi:MAG: Chemotaxis protein MotB [Ignavibacteria bacterium]|nr:MAG: Chemotaxis protein MotB [Ignavibacteria bacterium]KAF0160160.1 MAG: Chemotaxis protein MotB [Ignavibacteria bacterium]